MGIVFLKPAYCPIPLRLKFEQKIVFYPCLLLFKKQVLEKRHFA